MKNYLNSTLLLLLLLQARVVFAGPGDAVFIAKKSVWRYLDNGTDQGTAWRSPSFNDSGWLSGPAPLGYGSDGGSGTKVSYGGDYTNKYITTYFRRTFTLEIGRASCRERVCYPV